MNISLIDKLEMLVTVSRLLSSKLDIGELLTTIMRLATRVVNSERASLYLLDEKTNELYFHVALDLDEDLKKMRFKLGEGIVGTCAKEAKSIISNNLENDPRHTKKVDEKSGYVTRSLLTCPMIIKGKVIGVVQAINKIDGNFDESDKDSFEAFASQSAIAIENSRLFNSIKEEKNKLENIFKTITEGVVLTDESGNVNLINNSGINLLSYTFAKHNNIKDILADFHIEHKIDDIIANKKNIKFLIEKNEPKKFILEVTTIFSKDQEYDGGKYEIIWLFEDVTQKILEQRISREFLSLVSHKFKTPITSIIGYSQLLDSSGSLDEKLKKVAKSIVDQGFKLSRLIDKMLDFSVIESKNESDLKIQKINIANFIDGILTQLKDKYKDVEFETVIIDNFEIKVDIELFYKAILELVINGIKFNSKDKKKIIITTKSNKDEKIISIWDNGNGIPSNEITKIFDKFYQIESNFTGQIDGWGLGLSMVKKILSLHKFDIRVKSQPLKDTLFSIIIRN